ncbi:PREDICTED: cAMP-dependent protein kinase inhibitor beta isoform X1 [Condylura cristata]|uniref:cAMP-dependent protein kinase inhibitor beta isoform X1 n=2 Tax=Condylura cristata TaxID=143302 RepID=UPI000643521C|nr:PREDICTED: cAMP-dependent protein kinase inhibitor beta isoform X1 [Condylura cristata]
MDVHLDNLEGQENTSNIDKEKNSTGDKQDVAMRTDSSEMTEVEHVITSFAASARTGRRNAIPDIQGSTATGELSKLPLKLENLSLKKDVIKKDEETTQDQLEKPSNEEK